MALFLAGASKRKSRGERRAEKRSGQAARRNRAGTDLHKRWVNPPDIYSWAPSPGIHVRPRGWRELSSGQSKFWLQEI